MAARALLALLLLFASLLLAGILMATAVDNSFLANALLGLLSIVCCVSAFVMARPPAPSSEESRADHADDIYSRPRSRVVDGRAVEFVDARMLGREITIARVTCDADIVFSIVPRSEGVVDRSNPFITTGDEAFDARYAVEGAPRDIVKGLLDPDLRRMLLERGPLRARLSRLRWKPLDTRQVPLGWLEIVVDGWSKEDAIGPIATLLASRLEDAVAQRRIGGYRGSSELEDREENEEEVLEFEEAIARR